MTKQLCYNCKYFIVRDVENEVKCKCTFRGYKVGAQRCERYRRVKEAVK